MRRLLAVVAAGLLLAACGDGPAADRAATPASAPAPDPTPMVLLPDGRGPTPVVVLVPGGGWTSAEPAGLVPLAQHLADAGSVAATITYRTAHAAAYFPLPVQDVLCAAATVVAEAAAAGRSGGPLVLVGHSAGAPLALLAGLRPDELAGQCDRPAVVPDAVAGLAGAYDVRALPQVAVDLFGVPLRVDPELWDGGDVGRWVEQRPALPVLLVHGGKDDVVPPSMSRSLGESLAAAGHPVRLELLPEVDHLDVFEADVVGSLLAEWVRGLT